MAAAIIEIITLEGTLRVKLERLLWGEWQIQVPDVHSFMHDPRRKK